MANTHTKKFTISSYDLNPGSQARLTTIANFFQEMAYQHADQLGFGYRDLKEAQIYWVLSRMKIRMNNYPVWDDQIRVETWHNGMERLFGIRDFKVVDAAGNILGIATSAWLILDAQTRRPVRNYNEILQSGSGKEPVFGERLDKIAIPDHLDVLYKRKVVFSDLDIMGHVNNVKYMEWCIDAALTSTLADVEIREFEINFMNEALLGDEIEIFGTPAGNEESFFSARRTANEQEIFRVRLVWSYQGGTS